MFVHAERRRNVFKKETMTQINGITHSLWTVPAWQMEQQTSTDNSIENKNEKKRKKKYENNKTFALTLEILIISLTVKTYTHTNVTTQGYNGMNVTRCITYVSWLWFSAYKKGDNTRHPHVRMANSYAYFMRALYFSLLFAVRNEEQKMNGKLTLSRKCMRTHQIYFWSFIKQSIESVGREFQIGNVHINHIVRSNPT